MRYTVPIFLLSLILGIIFVGCYLKSDFGVKTEQYTGPQTVDALMEAFDARYSSIEQSTTSEVLQLHGEKRHIEFTLADVDAKYPREEWLQMLLNRGVTIQNFNDYYGYLNIRSNLILKEFHAGDNWETVKAAYIDTEIRNHQRIIEAKRANSEVTDWIMVDENALPNIPGVIYVQKTESTASIWHSSSRTESENGEILSIEGSELSEKQKLNLLNTGAVPKGWEVVYVDEDGNHIR